MKESKSSSAGIGFGGLLALLFIALKLIGVLDWKWIWVLSPLWIAFGLGLLIYVSALVLMKLDERKWRNKRNL